MRLTLLLDECDSHRNPPPTAVPVMFPVPFALIGSLTWPLATSTRTTASL